MFKLFSLIIDILSLPFKIIGIPLKIIDLILKLLGLFFLLIFLYSFNLVPPLTDIVNGYFPELGKFSKSARDILGVFGIGQV